MKKKLLYLASIITIFLLIYTITWFVIITSVAKQLNEQYAGRYINTKLIETEPDYFIKFAKIISYGFPFKMAIQVIGWQEEGETNLIKLNSPIYLGYDLLKQICFISYSGEATGHYKPVELKFGAKFKTGNYSIFAKIPLSFKLLKIFTQKKDSFELINFIKKIELRSENTQIFDLYDDQILYNEDHTVVAFSFDKHKYYTDINDFKNNIPQKLNISYSTKILESNVVNRRVPAGILLYRFTWPFAFNFRGNFYIKTNKIALSDFSKDLEITMSEAESSSESQKSLTTILYRNRVESDDSDTYLKIASKLDLKTGFSDKLLEAIPYLLSYIANLPKNLSVIDELKYIGDNKSKFSLAELENHQYNLDLDLNFIVRNKNTIRAQINNLSLFSNDTGVRLSSEFKINSLGKVDIDGVIVFNNYQATTNIITNYLFNLGRFKTFSDDSRSIYKEGTQYFLKSISDYPNSNSNIISFEYKLDSTNLKDSKIGTAEFNKITPLYYLGLYKAAAAKLHSNDKVITKLRELIPDFDEHQKLFKQFMIQPFQEIDSNIWQEMTK